MSEFDKLLSDPASRTELCAEIAVVRVAELIARRMNEAGMSRSEFAHAMKVTPGRVTQILGGDGNLQLRTIAKALAVLGLILEVDASSIESLSSDGWKRADGACDNEPAQRSYALAA